MSIKRTLELLQDLIGEMVFVKCLGYDDYYYNDSARVEEFTQDDYEYYKDNLLSGEIDLLDYDYIIGLDYKYHLITFRDLVIRC